MTELDVVLRSGRIVHTVESPGEGPVLVWHHGSPHTGALVPPLLEAAAARDIRLVTYARPSYGGSTPAPGRDVASAADDVAQVADELGIDTFAVMGSSGGGPHALACAALLADRVRAAVCFSGLAPRTADVDWFAGMASDAALRAATDGREARARLTEEFDPAVFTDADWAALSGPWSSLGEDAGRAAAAGQEGLVDDDVALASPWGFDPAQISAPVLLVHGQQDAMVPASHSDWLADRIPRAELWSRPDDGHVSVLTVLPQALDWVLARTSRAR